MSWDTPTPPVYPYWKGLMILSVSAVITVGLVYLLFT